jgi:hypothetical protein
LTIRTPLSLLITILLLVISGCSVKNTLPDEMPNDFDFLVQFGVGSKNEINTFDNTVTKDLVVDGTITEKIPLTKEEIKRIYQKMKQVNVLEPKKLEPKKKSCMQTPYEEDKWKIKLNGETITFYLTEEYCNPTKDAKQLFELRNYIFDIVLNKDEYKELPEPNGGYK